MSRRVIERQTSLSLPSIGIPKSTVPCLARAALIGEMVRVTEYIL